MRTQWLTIIGCILLVSVLFLLGHQNAHWQSGLLQTLPTDANPVHQAYQESQKPQQQQLLLWFKAPKHQAPAVRQYVQQQMVPYWADHPPHLHVHQQFALQPLLDYYRQSAGTYAPKATSKMLQESPQHVIHSAQQRLQQPSPIWIDIEHDPLLLTQAYVEQLPNLLPGFDYREPLYERSDTNSTEYLLALTSPADAMNQDQARMVVAHIETQLTALRVLFPDLEIARSGLVFHADAAATQAKYEMSLFGALSLSCVLIMLIVVFRSLRHLLFTSFVIASSAVIGLTAVLWLFPTPHILVLVFATTLIGLCVDYVFHASIAASDGKLSWSAVVPALTLGGLTTIVGYAMLILVPLPLLQQLGVFMAVSISCVLLLVIYFVPRWHINKPPQQAWQNLHLRLAQRYGRIRTRNSGWGLAILALLMMVLTGVNYHSDDSVRQLASSPEHLLQQEQKVRDVTQAYFDADVLLIYGETKAQMLARYADVSQQLPEWQTTGLLSRWQSLFDYVPLPAQQQELMTQLDQFWQTSIAQDYLQWLGLEQPRPAPVGDFGKIGTHPLATLFVAALPNTDGYLGIIRLAGISDALQYQLTDFPYVELFNPLQQAADALGEYRNQLENWLLALLALAWIVLTVCLKSPQEWRAQLSVSSQIVSVIIVALGSALTFALWQQPLNVFHLVGAVLVLVLGLDYGIFCASGVERAHVLQAISLSAGTTIFAFGALSFSSTPAIAAFGQVVLVGVLVAAILSPLLQKPIVNCNN